MNNTRRIVNKRIADFVSPDNILETRGPKNPIVRGMTYDSREVKEDYLFFALPGVHSDGHRFIPSAIQQGARVIVHSSPLDSYEPGVAYLRVQNSRTIMSPLAAAFYDHPSRKMVAAGVTGTDGKSSTVSYLRQLIAAAGERCGFLSTVEFHNGTELSKNAFRQSTPEPPEVHRLLQEMLDEGCSCAVVEATSHGLSPRNNRLGDVDFNLGILTNISHEHLEFHGTMDQYVRDKSRLMASLNESHSVPATAVLPAAEAYLPRFLEAAGNSRVLLYGSNTTAADYTAVDIREDEQGIRFTLVHREDRYPCSLSLQGLFNVDNAAAALIAAASMLNTSVAELVPLLPTLQPVRGRMQPVRRGQPFSVLVDYAHSPGAFEKLFPLLRERCEGRLIALFGSAGERDREKRPIQGHIASRFADIVFLCDEDPRGEESISILEEIAAGCEGKTRGEDLFLIPDRKEAIARACRTAHAGDLLVCLGKGHEASIIHADGPRPWDEEQALVAALAEMGYQ
jgi:UDP-N-acetylmuramoyl-L-alanyl-D-glutamate--2,6-diaminopimelate ligase